MNNPTEDAFSPAKGKASPYAWYVIAVLTVTYAVHGMDRMIINVLLEPIREEFGLSDSALGLLSGMGYAVPFAVAGLPLGILIDRVSRKRLLASLVAIWSAFTFIGGLAWNYFVLLLVRMGVGAAESGSPPAALSLISDYFPARSRASAVSFFYVGAPTGGMLGAYFGGLITQAYDWRTALFIAAIPGFVIALIILLSVREPARGSQEPEQPARESDAGLRDCVASLRNPGMSCIVAAIILASMAAVGVGAWTPALLMRAYNMPVGDAGQLTALISLSGIAGTIVGGILADAVSKGRTQRLLIISALSCLASVPPLVIALMQSQVSGFVVAIVIWDFLHVFYFGPAYSLALGLVPPGIRGRMIAMLFILTNILGAGLGPQLVGLSSDWLAATGDENNLIHATMFLAVPLGLAGILFLMALIFVPRGVAAPIQSN